ncbi:hypothetical protein [Streptomyces sp. NPDC048644]|uniref:hypothetical protein n=1 Tax=Streptomyces sp. NPDC048644 TaxID=3365582 RepID=UPI003724A47A
MRPAHISAAVLSAVAALTLCAPAASARVVPDPMAAGERVTVGDDGRCTGEGTARARSTLFGTVPLRPSDRGRTGAATVARGATVGRYTVTVDCGAGGPRYTETVTVRGVRTAGMSVTQAAGGLALLVLVGGAAHALRRTLKTYLWDARRGA